MNNGLVSVWWCPGPRDGEIVPDHPPVELTGDLISVDLCDTKQLKATPEKHQALQRLLDPLPTTGMQFGTVLPLHRQRFKVTTWPALGIVDVEPIETEDD